MDRVITILLPHPVRALHPNGRVHWAVRARAVRRARALACGVMLAELLSLRQARFLPRRYKLIWYYKGIAPDADNCLASCKAYLDGCCDAFCADDRNLECAGIRRVHDKELASYVRLEFSADEAGEGGADG